MASLSSLNIYRVWVETERPDERQAILRRGAIESLFGRIVAQTGGYDAAAAYQIAKRNVINPLPEVPEWVGEVDAVFAPNGVPAAVWVSIASMESGLDPENDRGDGGASVGLFQLHERGQGAGMSVEDRKNPVVNAQVIARAMVPIYAKYAAESGITFEPPDTPTPIVYPGGNIPNLPIGLPVSLPGSPTPGGPCSASFLGLCLDGLKPFVIKFALAAMGFVLLALGLYSLIPSPAKKLLGA